VPPRAKFQADQARCQNAKTGAAGFNYAFRISFWIGLQGKISGYGWHKFSLVFNWLQGGESYLELIFNSKKPYLMASGAIAL